ncbi:YceI family protein [Dyella telluris]|uniref:YceI family protein n=1 Tax=Dyella telluris TaxID=2763498 RepID=A0A7G8Q7C4_9GAMM|nr:YceI family protein [Dyella telluris]QNK02682.1 YceI family protein [Dyella telluris]
MPTPRLPRRLLFALACALAPLAVTAAPVTYRYDTTHSQILFSIDHNGFSRPFGRLHIAQGWLRFDADDWSRSATELDIDLASLDMGAPAWNAAVLKPAYLDADKARLAHFASTSVERKDETHGVLHGNLTLRGVSHTVDIPFTFNRLGTTIYGMHTVIGFSGTAMLQRDDYGMTATPNSVGHSVSVWLELEAIQEDTHQSNKEQP